MQDRLPSLTALRAFEAAARHLSFAKAAAELNVTPAALSFQIKGLEADLGQPLFHRLTRAVELTDAGRVLAPDAARGFENLRRGWQAARRSVDVNRLTVTAGPAFTSKWLAPRLGDFARAHPDIELRLVTSLSVLDLARDGIDVALRFGEHAPETDMSEPLMDEFVAPFAPPAMAGSLKSPEDLLEQTLIQDESMSFLPACPRWKDWFMAAGIDVPEHHGPVFTQADHALDMGLQGGGVVLGRFAMGLSSLRDGALVAPFRLALSVAGKHRVVFQESQAERPAVKSFRAWLHEQVSQSESIRRQFDIRPFP